MKRINKCFVVTMVLVFSLVIGALLWSYCHSDVFVYNKSIDKTVEIKSSIDEETWNYSTGFFVDSNGTILTNRHALISNKTNEVSSFIKVRMPSEDEWVDGEFVRQSEDSDLAIIKVDKSNTRYFSFARKYDNGETIYTIGNPSGFGLSFSKGNISSKKRNVIYNGNVIDSIQTSLVINEGNSGGPVFNRNGKLIGIVSFRLKDIHGNVIQGVTFIIPLEDIKNFLK